MLGQATRSLPNVPAAPRSLALLLQRLAALLRGRGWLARLWIPSMKCNSVQVEQALFYLKCGAEWTGVG